MMRIGALKAVFQTQAGPATRAAGHGQRAIIDIGSNTVRMVIYGGPLRAPVVLYNEKVTARLGRGVAETGKLGTKAMAQALAALARYAAVLRLRGVHDVQTVATAAVRDAANGGDFLERVRALGLAPRLLSGEEEAVASAHGVQAGFPGAVGVVGDLGGGSLELIDIDGQHCTHGTSLPLGTLRLPALRADGGAKFARRVRKMLDAVEWRGAYGQDFYLVGGSWRAFGRYAMLRCHWPIDDIHGFSLSPQEALRIARSLRVGKVQAKSTTRPAARPSSEDSRKQHQALAAGMQVSSGRLASLPDAALLLEVLVRKLKPARLVFSAWGLREGLLASQLDPALAGTDPMLAGVAAFVEGQGAAYGEPGLADAARKVADWIYAICAYGGKKEAALRLAATMLALASMRTEPNLRPELAANWALRKRWIGMAAEERVMLALAVLANNGRTGVPDELLGLIASTRIRQATAWGLAIRLCRRFSGDSVPALAGSALVVDGGRLVLAVREEFAVLCNEIVEKDLRQLADYLGLPCELRHLKNDVPLPHAPLVERDASCLPDR